MAAEIAGEFQSQPELIRGSGGVFVVTMDGAVIYDKKKTGTFPDDGEVVDLIKAKRKGKARA